MTQSLSQSSQNTTLSSLAKDATIALIIQVTGLVLTYLVQIFLARWMGKAEYGMYEYVMSWSLLLAIPAGLGLPRTVLRLVSEYRVKETWGVFHGIVRGSWMLTIVMGMAICLGGSAAILILNYYHPFNYAIPLLVGIWLIPLQALVELQLETARAVDDITLAYVPSLIIWPFLLLCGGFLVVEKQHHLTSVPMIGIATVMLFGVLVFQLWLLWDKVSKNFESATPIYEYREWLSIALTLLLQGAFRIILQQTDIVMVGSILGPEQAGMYSAAVKTALWASFVLQIVNMVAAPAFATLYTQGDMKGLQKVVSAMTTWIFWPSLVISFLLMVFSFPVLRLFGHEFVGAGLSLKILVLGQLVNALCGCAGYLMVMTGHQKQSMAIFGYSALINIVLNAILIPIFDIKGAAIATSFTMIVWNVGLSILVIKHVNIHPSIFYSLFGGNDELATESSEDK